MPRGEGEERATTMSSASYEGPWGVRVTWSTLRVTIVFKPDLLPLLVPFETSVYPLFDHRAVSLFRAYSLHSSCVSR